MTKKILFVVGGGFGRNVMATAVARQIKFKYPDCILHVQASYPDAFANLDFVDKAFPLEAIPYFHDEHKDFEIWKGEPYEDLDYRNGKDHFIDTWCRLIGVDVPQKRGGTIIIDDQEKNIADALLLQAKLDRPLIAFQYVGGTSFYDPNAANDPTRIKHYRDLPHEIAQEVVKKLVEKGFAVLHVGLPTEKPLQNAIPIYAFSNNQVINPRWMFALLDKCAGCISIDSLLQHTWIALGKKNATVLWGGTRPENLGYSENNNLFQKEICANLGCSRPSVLGDFLGNKQLWKCPFSAKCMKFNADLIVNSFMNTCELKPTAHQECKR